MKKNDDDDDDDDDDGVGVAMGQGVEIGAELVLSSRWPLDSLMLCKGLTAPALPALPGRELNS